MSPALLALMARAGSESPMARKEEAGRLLLVDGDWLAYFCAGSDDTPPDVARISLFAKLSAAKKACGASTTLVLCTHPESNKGGRYAISRAKPYQGLRKGSKPKNWARMRSLIEKHPGQAFTPILSKNCEADDLFADYSCREGARNVVIYTVDKDMRMVPGWHMSPKDHSLVFINPSQFHTRANGKSYGERWFWTQMLIGDPVDNIPGIPGIGEVKAEKLLSGCTDRGLAYACVSRHYKDKYAEAWETAMLEQACLLWLRNTTVSDVLDVCIPGNPMDNAGPAAREEILRRFMEVEVMNEKAKSLRG